MSLFRLFIDAYCSESWLNTLDRLCIDVFWIRFLERCNIYNEITIGHTRIENLDNFINTMNDIFDAHESQFLSELETHSERDYEM